MKINYKRLLIVIISIIVLIIIYKLPKLFINNNYKPLPEVKLKEIDKKESMAIMISNDGSNYQEYTKDIWPSDNYEYKEAKCMDNNGSLVDEDIISFENDTVVLETNQTVFCTLYFDYKGTINILRENDPNKVLSNDELGGMYRYQGVGVSSAVDATHKLVDNNYICFGTNDKESYLKNEEKYMYRIIGITKDGELKLIKMQPIEENVNENDNKKFQWWNNSSEDIEWPNSLLFKRLNGLSKGETPGDLGDTDIFINSTRYEYMAQKTEWYALVADHDWMYGDSAYNENINLNGEILYGLADIQTNGLIVYDIETGLKPTIIYDIQKNELIRYQWSKEKSIPAKIGLMYLHDYYLAYDNIRNWQSDYDTTNWLYKDNNKMNDVIGEWHMTRRGASEGQGYSVYDLRTGGIFNSCFLQTGLDIATRPVFYLKNDIQISGKGAIDNPYLINIANKKITE